MKQSSGKGAPTGTTRAVLWAGTEARQAGVDAKWARYYRVLLALRERLLGEGVELLEQVSPPREPHSMDIAEWAAEEFDRDFSLSRLSTIQHALLEVDDAIERIVNGSYAVCQVTGKPIPEKRLIAMPWTRFARDAEERLEKEGAVSGPHLGHVGSIRDSLTGDRDVLECAGEEETGESVANDEALRCVDLPPPRKSKRDLVAYRDRRRFARH